MLNQPAQAINVPPPAQAERHDPVRKQIRGSSLLLSGRVFAIGVNLVTQVMIVRYLTQMEFGAWAYALAVVAFFQHTSSLGLRLGIPRYLPLYHERGEHQKLLGAIVVGFLTAALTSAAIILTVFLVPSLVSWLVRDGQQAGTLLLIIIFVVPCEAFDDVLEGVFASFTRARTIFTRRHLLGPGLRLAAICITMLLHGSSVVLAFAYLFGYVLILVVYLPALHRMLKDQGLLSPGWTRRMEMPIRELFHFSLPLLATDLLGALGPLVSLMALGYYRNLDEVALFRAVLPLAAVNRMVRITFETLYTPTAARLNAANDTARLNELYWRTAAWVAVLSFPVFAATASVARPLLLLLYGPTYEEAWPVLAVLSCAYYFNAALGYNAVTLQLLGRLRFLVTLDVAASAATIAASFLLVPRYGAMGAAVATAGSVVLVNLIRQFAIGRISHIQFFSREYATTYMLLSACTVAVFTVQWILASQVYLTLGIAALSAALVTLVACKSLKVAETFPELMKWRLVRVVLA